MSTGNLNFGWDALNQSLTLNGVITWGGIVGPFFSPAGAGIIYYERADNRLKASENGGPPVNLLTGGGGGSALEFVQNNHVSLPQENKISFDGTIIKGTDNPGATATDITIQKADATHDGYLSHTDFNTFSAGNGTVTSVALTGDGTVFNSAVPGSPITTSGTLAPTLHTQNNNLVFAGPNGGGPLAPTFRSLVAADLPAGTGTVTSVALTTPPEFTVAGSPITTSGTLAISKVNQSANTHYAGPTSGGATAPTFRALVNADLPTSGVSAGSYTNTNLTVNAQGIITAASNGSGGGGGTDISVQAKDGTSQLIGTSFTAVTFAAENFDTDNMHSTVTNTSRLTCNTAGKFQLHFAGAATRGSGASYYVELRLRLNGTTTLHQVQHLIQPEASQLDETVEISLLTNLAATDYVEVLAMQSSTGFAFDGGNIPTIFEAVRQPG